MPETLGRANVCARQYKNSLLPPLQLMNKFLSVLVVFSLGIAMRLHAQTASFNFSLAPQSVGTPWVNIYGNPAGTVCSGTSSGITVSSIATSNWAPYSNGSSAFDGGGASGGTFFPPAVMLNHWFQNGSFYSQYNSLVPQLLISGLNQDSVYTIKMTGSFVPIGSFELNPIRYTVTGAIIYGYVDINGDNNTSGGAVFQNVAPDASGNVKVYVNTYGSSNTASICGIQIISGHTSAPTPVVALVHPANNNIIPEDGNVTISATASETGGTIQKVEFYADTTKIGEAAAAPYSMVWTGPDPGTYQIKARAIDGFGNTSTATVNITVESLNYFWSTTGNIATGGDTSFVGTVDTNRLAFRTNNIERMSISKDGNLTIGGKDTASHPAFRVYSNGDLVVGTTMNRSVNTDDQVGMRYNARSGILQIGSSDRLDSTLKTIAYDIWPTSGLILNTDEPNTIKGRLMNTVLAATTTNLDSTWRTENSFIGTELNHFTGGPDNSLIRSFIGGYDNTFSAPIDGSCITGAEMSITKVVSYSNISGYAHSSQDAVNVGLVSGVGNQFGGLAQLTSGMSLINRTRAGTTLGSGNVDFATLPYTGWGDQPVANADQYPLLALGNASGQNTARSNALTVLYNGRTQINTTGFTNQLTQANVTPAAALDVVSTNTGVLLPRLTNAQRNAIVAGDLRNGLLLYNTDSSLFQYYNGSTWNSVGSGSNTGTSGRWLFNGTANTAYDSANNIAIGTNDAKGYMLAVKGSALFTRVQVLSASNWPDYVFKKEYRLRKLEDLATYIDKYHHLPEIVSAAKVGKDGFDLGANQAAILKKVEELTLYLIDENKQLRSQNSQLEGQSKKVEELEKQVAEQNAQFQQQQRQIDELKALIKKK
jgi:hypothetical protein